MYSDTSGHGQFHVPGWNGDPATFRDYEKQVMLFRLAADLKKDTNFCALLIQHLSGAAQESSLQMPEGEWQPVSLEDIAREQATQIDASDKDMSGKRREIRENVTRAQKEQASII